jgi:DNA-binding PadR family transcriptional regulator
MEAGALTLLHGLTNVNAELKSPVVAGKGYAVLGVLSLGPRSGYDIARDLAATVGHFWHESYGQIYPTLHQLVDARLATVRTYQQPGRPDRNEYAITESGRDVLLRWLAEPQARVSRPRNEVLLKLFFGSRVPAEISIAHIQRYQADLRQRMASSST